MVDGPTPLRFSLFGGGLTLDSRLLLTRLLEVQRQPLLLLQSERNRLQQIAQTLRQAQGVLSALRERLTALLREPLVGTRTVTVAGPLRATVSDPRAVRVMLGPGATPRTLTLFIERLAGFTRVTSTARLGVGTNPAERVPRGEESRHRRAPRPVDLDRPLARTNFAVPLRGLRGEFIINDVMIPWDATVDTLRTIIERINQANAGVVATYDPTTDRLTLTATRPGPEPIRLRDVTGNLLAVLRLAGAPQQLGEPAVVRLDDGTRLTSPRNVLEVFPGVTVELLQAAPGPVVITLSQPTETRQEIVAEPGVQAVRSMVESFNAALAQLATLANTPGDGLLVGASVLVTLRQHLVRAVMEPVVLGGERRLPAELGLTVEMPVRGQVRLALNEERLRQALETAPEETTGVLRALAGRLQRVISSLLEPGGLIPGQLRLTEEFQARLSQRLRELEERLAARQRLLERQFAQMETALQRFQQQQGALTLLLLQLLSPLRELVPLR